MNINVFYGILIPFLGTSVGAACVIFMKKNLNAHVQRALTGFASGVMVAASVWSLLLPSIEQSGKLGKFSFVPAVAGFWAGVLFLLLLDHVIPHIHQYSDSAEGPKSKFQKTTMMVLAVTLHNIPEGMAVSLPLASDGMKKKKAFFYGQASGFVEPLSALVGLFLVYIVRNILPFILSFASGAMIYVVVEELIPSGKASNSESKLGTIGAILGFTLMMILDLALS